jgi:hypothetical protein
VCCLLDTSHLCKRVDDLTLDDALQEEHPEYDGRKHKERTPGFPHVGPRGHGRKCPVVATGIPEYCRQVA